MSYALFRFIHHWFLKVFMLWHTIFSDLDHLHSFQKKYSSQRYIAFAHCFICTHTYDITAITNIIIQFNRDVISKRVPMWSAFSLVMWWLKNVTKAFRFVSWGILIITPDSHYWYYCWSLTLVGESTEPMISLYRWVEFSWIDPVQLNHKFKWVLMVTAELCILELKHFVSLSCPENC